MIKKKPKFLFEKGDFGFFSFLAALVKREIRLTCMAKQDKLMQ